jgi:hypothetical protein
MPAESVSTKFLRRPSRLLRTGASKATVDGALKYQKVGRHRRIEFQDLELFQQQLQTRSQDALQNLTDLPQKLGLY